LAGTNSSLFGEKFNCAPSLFADTPARCGVAFAAEITSELYGVVRLDIPVEHSGLLNARAGEITIQVWNRALPGLGRFVRYEEYADELRTMVARIDALIPYLATKADLAEKSGKTYMRSILAALLTAYACGLTALAVLK
jgi:hypothetical protein